MHGFLFTVAMSKQNSSAASSLFHGPINKVTVTIDIIAAHNWCVGHFGQRHISHQFNRDWFPHFELFGTSKNETPPIVSVHHGMKKYVNEICLLSLFTEIRLFVYILWQCKK